MPGDKPLADRRIRRQIKSGSRSHGLWPPNRAIVLEGEDRKGLTRAVKTRFGGYLVRKPDEPAVWTEELVEGELGAGDVLLRVRYSALNYKDALALTARGRVLRTFPVIPGIDLAGEVVSSEDPRFAAGDRVFATGMGVGEEHSGGFAQYARLPATKLQALPPGLNFQTAMGLGTAGFTAMLAVFALEDHGVRPTQGEVLVTGAGGGVGGFAIALLAGRGFAVTAVTGRPAQAGYLRELGASKVLDRSELAKPGKPLASERWQGSVDSVGGIILANVLAAMKRGGSVAACGNAGGAELPTSVFPFILRGVNLLGIDSVHCPASSRARAWQALAETPPGAALEAMCRTEPLARASALAADLLEGKVRGRVVLAVE